MGCGGGVCGGGMCGGGACGGCAGRCVCVLANILKGLEGEAELPKAESGLELWDGGEAVQELFSWAQREVGVLCSGISDLVLLFLGW